MAKKPFGDLVKKPEVRQTPKGFMVRAVRAGIDPTTNSFKDRGEEFYLADPVKFSDATEEKIRRGKKTGVMGWMERVDGNRAPLAEPAEPETQADKDVI